MQKFVLLLSVLSLAACGGGSGGGVGMGAPSEIITPAMLSDASNPQARELSQKLKAIEYVENNLSSLIDNGELNGSNAQLGRSATTGRLHNGRLTMADLNARYQEALRYFDILKKVVNADENDTDSSNITNKEIKIAYSLSADKPYDEINKYDLPDIDVKDDADETNIDVNTFFSNVRISIADKIESNIGLKNSVTQDVTQDIPVLASDAEIDTNASLINSSLLDNLSDVSDLNGMFRDFAFHIDPDTGKIDAVDVGDEQDGGLFSLVRRGKTSVFESENKIWFFDFVIPGPNGVNVEAALEGLENKVTDRSDLADLVEEELDKMRYAYLTAAQKNQIVSQVATDANYGEWTGAKFVGDMHSLGKVNGLQYSDFGYYTLDDYYFTFTYDGGISDKKITDVQSVQMPQSGQLVFQGTAAGQLQQNLYKNGENLIDLEDNNRPIITNTGAATLTLEVGDDANHTVTEVVNMPFNNWYDVTVTKTGDRINSIVFGNGSSVDNDWKVYNENVQYTPSNSSVYDYNNDGVAETSSNNWPVPDPNTSGISNISTQTTMTTTYYGVNAPSEATGFINHVDEYNYIDSDSGQPMQRQVWFDATFGGTLQQPAQP